MPTMDEGDIIIQLEMVPSINLATTVEIVQSIERAILDEVPDIVRVVSRSGSDEIGMDPMGLNETDMFLQLKPPVEWQAENKQELESELRLVLEKFPGVNFGLTQPIDMRVSEMLTGSRGDVAIKLFSNNLDELNARAPFEYCPHLQPFTFCAKLLLQLIRVDTKPTATNSVYFYLQVLRTFIE